MQRLEDDGKQLAWKEIGAIVAVAYPSISPQAFVNTFLSTIDGVFDQNSQEVGH